MNFNYDGSFGGSGEDEKSFGDIMLSLLHGALDIAGYAFDVADFANAVLYALENKPEEAMLCAIAIIPFAGSAIAGVSKAVKVVAKTSKVMEPIVDSYKKIRNAGRKADTIKDTMKAWVKTGSDSAGVVQGAGSKMPARMRER